MQTNRERSDMKKNKAKNMDSGKMKKMKKSEKNKNPMKVKVKSKKTQTSESEDIIDLILKDHLPIKELIETLKDSKSDFSVKQSTFSEFAPLLLSHAEPEQKSLYSRMKDDEKLREEAFEGDVEHALATQLIEELKLSVEDQDQWMAKVKVLAEVVEHHIEEEESEMLKKVKKEFDTETRNSIGQEYLDLRSEFEVGQVPMKPNKPKKPSEIRAH